jgi:two-component system chemotaxis response regulator CheB
MSQPDIVVIGASAGGLHALMDIVEQLPADLNKSILIVVHTKTEGESYLAEILGRLTELPVEFARDGAGIQPGRIYIAPPNVHMLVGAHGVRLHQGPRENGFRPAVDPLFRTAARHYGPRVMGVILSGALDDGTYGLKVVKAGGGVAVVQDPDEAAFPSMPLSALRYVEVDHVLPALQIAELITKKHDESTVGEPTMARPKETEPQNPAEETDVEQMVDTFGPPSGLTCPDCGGALWEITNGELVRYRCHVGHQFTTEGLDAEEQDAVENALWSAVRVLEEHAELRSRMATRAEAAGMGAVSSGFSESAGDSRRQADTIRELLFTRALPKAQPSLPGPALKGSNGGAGTDPNGKGRKPRARPR